MLMLRPGPLARRAPVRSLRGGVAGALLAAAFALLSLAAAAPPMFSEASANAALAAQLETVPDTASAGQSPLVRIVGAGAGGTERAERAVSRIPGLGTPSTTVSSIGAELLVRDALFSPYVTGPGGTARARLFGQPEPTSAIVPVGAPAPAGAGPGLWLPEPVAREIGARPGAAVTLGVTRRGAKPTAVAARVAGVYAVDAGGRVPANPRGSRVWTERLPWLPADTEFRTLPAMLLVTDVPTAGALADEAKDTLLYAAEGRLDPRVPTLAAAARTAAAVEEQAAAARDRPDVFTRPEVRDQVISGLPDLVRAATRVSDRTTGWAATVSAAGAVLGLLTVLAAVLLGLQRRAVELRNAVGSGVRPAGLAALTGLEMVVLAVPCAVLGLLGAWAVVAAVGPPGAVTEVSVVSAAWRAALAAAAGVLLAAAVTAVVATLLARPAAARTPRPVPWEAALVLVALTTAAGLVSREDAPGPPGALDLLLPVLVLAAAGAVAARLTQVVAGRRTAALRRPVAALAVRRIAAGGAPATLVVTALTTGIGLLAWSLAGTASVRDVTEDRVAVRAGAEATAGLDASWLLDEGAPRLPPPDPDVFETEPTDPLPASRVPPLPPGETVVWRGRITVPPEFGNLDVLVVDPARFAEVAAWGEGGELRRVRELMPRLAREDALTAARLRQFDRSRPVPAIAVGDVLQKPGDGAAVSTGQRDVPITVLDVVGAFPGYPGTLPMIVVPADSFLLSFGKSDPRVAPPRDGRFNRPPPEFTAFLWSNRGVAGLRQVLEPRELPVKDVATLARAAQEPDSVAAVRSLGFQVALGGCVAAIGLLVLALFADRAAARSRPADLLLARMGLGARGALRARAIELAVLTLVALLAAAAGIAALVPLGARLLDPGGGGAPAFVLRPDAIGAAVTAGAALAGLLLAVLAARARSRSGSAGEVLRDAG